MRCHREYSKKRFVAAAALAVALIPAALAETGRARKVPREILDRIVDDEPNPLPRNLAARERGLPLPPLPLRVDQPSGAVYTPSEYDQCEGLLIRWGSYNALLTELAVGVTTGDPEAIVYIVVTGASQQASCTSTLTAAGADMDQVEFITYTCDTVWIRDYGPRFIFEDDFRAIIDHTYNRPRPLDNLFNDYLSGLWGEPQYDLPLTHGGGNFHLFSTGDAFMSSLILAENPGQTEQDVMDLFAAYENLDLTIYEGFPTYFDSTRHIDMWMLPVRDDEIIIGEYAPSTGPPYTISEGATADLISRGYTVYRTPGWNSGGTHYTYTNAVVLNDLVFISEFGGSYTAQDAQARSVFQTAFPDHQVIGADCASIIHAAGAIHCIVMHVPATMSALQVTPGLGLYASGPVGGPFTPDSIEYTLENSTDTPIDYSVTHTVAWLTITNPTGTIAPLSTALVTVSINDAADALGLGEYADTVNIINLTDHDGDTTRDVELLVGVPEPIHVFAFDEQPPSTMSGEWGFGQPLGQGGVEHGNPDPASGATGANVCGVNLAGDYSTTPGGPWYFTMRRIDCTDLFQVQLRFKRWLNTDYQPYVSATVEVSDDGLSWVTVWENGASEITDSSWTDQVIDISEVADHESSVSVRWGYEVGSDAWAYSGWNVDDVEVWGVPPAEPECPGDLDGDGTVGVTDFLVMLGAWGPNPGHPADLDGDDTVGVNDFLLLLGSWGPCPV
jgi:agmatine/peptidylarginine deiminase